MVATIVATLQNAGSAFIFECHNWSDVLGAMRKIHSGFGMCAASNCIKCMCDIPVLTVVQQELEGEYSSTEAVLNSPIASLQPNTAVAHAILQP